MSARMRSVQQFKSNKDDETNAMQPNAIFGINRQRLIMYMTHFNITLYALCYWIQIGVMPYLTRNLGVDTQMFGVLQTVFSFVQLCGGPIYGRFGDLFGGKYSLILAFSSCVLSYTLLAVAGSIPVLFLSRLPSIVMHCMQGAQMVMTDITNDEDRASAIGRLGVSYGIGMTIGPLVGGFITKHYSEQAAAASAALGSIISIILVTMFIPANTKALKDTNDSANEKKNHSKSTGNVFDIKKYSSIFALPNFTFLFSIKVISAIPLGILQSMFSVVAMDYFNLQPQSNGLVLSYVGVLAMLVQGLIVGYLTKRFQDITLIKYSIAIISVSYFFMLFVNGIYSFVVVLAPLIGAGAILSVLLTSVVTKIVPTEDTGAALGLLFATHSLIRTISPTIGGFMYGYLGFPVFGITGTLVNGGLAFYLFHYNKNELVHSE